MFLDTITKETFGPRQEWAYQWQRGKEVYRGGNGMGFKTGVLPSQTLVWGMIISHYVVPGDSYKWSFFQRYQADDTGEKYSGDDKFQPIVLECVWQILQKIGFHFQNRKVFTIQCSNELCKGFWKWVKDWFNKFDPLFNQQNGQPIITALLVSDNIGIELWIILRLIEPGGRRSKRAWKLPKRIAGGFVANDPRVPEDIKSRKCKTNGDCLRT